MTTVALFHHCLGLTDGVRWFADQLRDAGHQVVVPDLFAGRAFDSIDAGVAYVDDELGMDAVIQRARAAVADVEGLTVVAGFSMGSVPAQQIAQTRPGVRAAVLYAGGVSTQWFKCPWPAGVALQIHQSERDEFAEPEETEALLGEVPEAEYYVYPGVGHLIADNTHPDFNPEAARLILDRTIALLARMDA